MKEYLGQENEIEQIQLTIEELQHRIGLLINRKRELHRQVMTDVFERRRDRMTEVPKSL